MNRDDVAKVVLETIRAQTGYSEDFVIDESKRLERGLGIDPVKVTEITNEVLDKCGTTLSGVGDKLHDATYTHPDPSMTLAQYIDLIVEHIAEQPTQTVGHAIKMTNAKGNQIQ